MWELPLPSPRLATSDGPSRIRGVTALTPNLTTMPEHMHNHEYSNYALKSASATYAER